MAKEERVGSKSEVARASCEVGKLIPALGEKPSGSDVNGPPKIWGLHSVDLGCKKMGRNAGEFLQETHVRREEGERGERGRSERAGGWLIETGRAGMGWDVGMWV
jgi:hypothetical protein